MSGEIRVRMIVIVHSNEAELGRVFVLKRAARKPRTTVATSFLENNSRVWWPTWHLNNFLLFFLSFFKSMTSSGPVETVRKPSVLPQLVQKRQRRKTVGTQSVTTAERNTLTKPGQPRNL